MSNPVSGLLAKLKIDGYILALISMVILASILPVRGELAVILGWVVKVAIALLFFLHGAKLSREAVVAGMTHWRLHLLILAFTFVLFLCCLPSTVQSSIAFTSIGRGNVAAAVCAASASNLLGIFLTPVLVGLLMKAHGTMGGELDSIKAVVVQLLLPFVAGQLLRPWVGPWIDRHKAIVGKVDRGSILLVVYAAFSAAVVEGIWTKVSIPELFGLLAACAVLLALVLASTIFGARLLGFSKADEVTIAFCGSKKSLASGVPMAGILFPGATAGLLVLPVMVFHQIQLMACSVLAQRYGARPADDI